MTKEQQFAKKAEMLKLLAPLGFTDPDPNFMDLIHKDTGIVIAATFITPANVIDTVYAIALNRGEEATINRVKDSLGI
jgi:hypothetical protein